MDFFHSLFSSIFWKRYKPKVLQHHPSLQNADLFFFKQRLKLKCLQSGNHQKFEHLPGTISTLKKYQSFFQMTFQDIDFFFFFFSSNIAATSTKGGKIGFLIQKKQSKRWKTGPTQAESFEIKICPFRINEESDKTRERIYRGRRQPSAGSRPRGGRLLPAHKLWGRMQNSPPAHTPWEVRLHARRGPFWP